MAQEWANGCYFGPNPQVTIDHPTVGQAVRKGQNLYIANMKDEGVESAIEAWSMAGSEDQRYTQVCR